MVSSCHATSTEQKARVRSATPGWLLTASLTFFVVACGQPPGADPSPATGGSSGTGGSAGSGGVKGTGGAAAPGTGGAQTGQTGGATGAATGGSTSAGPDASDDATPSPDAVAGADAPPSTPPGGSGSPVGEPSPEGMVYTAPMAPPGNSPLTQGFTQMPFRYRVHSPRNLPPADRYSHDAATNTYTLWVKTDDQPFQAGNNTDPRTEMRWVTTYAKGVNMFDADVWIEPKTHRTNIMQVFMTTPRPTSLMITAWEDGNLRTYFGGGPVLKPMANGVWWNLKTVHDTAAHTITVYGDDKLLGTFSDRGGSNWYFKNGVYGSLGRSETRWRNIRYWVK